jgi:ABC-2 type transport system permease protein
VLVAAPVAYALLFGLTYINAKVYAIPIVVVDRDGSVLSRAIARSLDAHEALHVQAVTDDETALPELFRREECWAAVVIPPGLERDVKRGSGANVVMMVNASNIILGNYAQKGIHTVLATYGAGLGIDRMERRGIPSFAAPGAYAPVELQTRTLFNPASNYALFVVPLLLMLLVHQVVALGAGMAWAKAFEGGRSLDHTSAWWQITQRGRPYFVAALFWIGVSVVGMHAWLDIPFRADPLTFLLFSLLTALCVVLVGSLAGALVRNKVGVVQMLFFGSMPLLLLSGESWPLDAMPWPLRVLATLLPSTHIMHGYRRLALEGAGPGAMASTFVWLAVLAVALACALHRVVRRASVLPV